MFGGPQEEGADFPSITSIKFERIMKHIDGARKINYLTGRPIV